MPSLYIGKTKVQSSAKAQALTGISSLTLEGSTAELKWDNDKTAWRLSGNLLVDGFVASGGTGSSGGSSGGAVDVSYVANLTAGTLLGTLTINGTDYQILAPSLTASSINAALGNTPVARATADAEGNSISGTYAKTSSLPTKVSQLTNDSGYITSYGYLGTTAIQASPVRQAVTGITSLVTVGGRVYGSGDDEGIVISKAPNGYAALTLGSPSGVRTVFYLSTGNPFWRYNDGTTSYDISHPAKSGTIALTSDIPTNNNQLTNGAGYITSSGSCAYATSAGSAPASDVYAWAKATEKPSYSFGEITSKPTTLSGYGITDAYTASTIDSKLSGYLHGDVQRADDVSTVCNFTYISIMGGINAPSGAQYGSLLTLPYRTLANNTRPDYAAQIYIPNGDDPTNSNDMFFRTSLIGSWNAWQKVITSSNIGSHNAGSATKLATARTIWGQSFDGTGNVSGALTGVTDLTASGKITGKTLTLDGTNLLEWDSAKSAWKFNGNLIATGFIASGDISAQAAALAEEEDRIAALEAQVAELQAEIANLKAS